MNIPDELARRARNDVVLYNALTRVLAGDWTLEQAMTEAALVLSRANEHLRSDLQSHIAHCVCRPKEKP
jgi:hypothetical protein